MRVVEVELGGRKYRVSDTGKVYSMLGFELKQERTSKGYLYCNRQIIMRSDIKLPQLFASWSNSL